ncbi:MAG: cysteine desulfurase family protein [Candidatus Binataceae bacterium]
MSIYFDHNAGSPPRPAVRAALSSLDEHGNPASVHHAGQRACRALESARAAIARLIGAEPNQIVFTSGGTEANNLALFGTMKAAAGRRRIVSSAIEHSSVMAPLAELEARGYEVVRIAPESDGHVSAQRVIAALDRDTALLTLGVANSETGAIQDLGAISRAAVDNGAMLHLDAAQALGRIPVDITDSGCDLMTLSAHKIGGPSGSGALYVRQFAKIAPLMLGGPQEGAMRAGTPNLSGAVGFGVAADEVAVNLAQESALTARLADLLLRQLMNSIPGLMLHAAAARRLPNTLNLAFPGVLGESMLIALDLEGVEVSMGSACAAGAVEPSHVLLAMGCGADEARSSLRLSLGWSTTEEEIERAGGIIARVWRRVRAAEPSVACLSSDSVACGESA